MSKSLWLMHTCAGTVPFLFELAGKLVLAIIEGLTGSNN